MVESMAGSKKVTISLPARLAEQVRDEVAAGRAETVSSLVCEAIERRLRSDRLDDVLAALRREIGPPSREDRAWVRRVLGR
jgi:Arc/MetJ-type ribon-helix-helix transcriptional regulator